MLGIHNGEAEVLPSWRAAAGATDGRFEGAPHGSDISFFVVDAAPGEGPVLHRHPYTETLVVQGGHGRFEVGGRTIDAGAGDVVVVSPGTAHAFRALGPERLQLVAVHAAARMETTLLEHETVPGDSASADSWWSGPAAE